MGSRGKRESKSEKGSERKRKGVKFTYNKLEHHNYYILSEKMHGRVKVKSTAQQQEEKRIEREGKLKSYRFASLDLTLLPVPLEEELLF